MKYSNNRLSQKVMARIGSKFPAEGMNRTRGTTDPKGGARRGSVGSLV